MADRLPFTQAPLNKARIDKFVMVLNIPEKVKRIDSKTVRSNKTLQLHTLQFSVWGTVVPQIAVPSVNMRYGGGNMPISSHSRPEWDPITVKFNIDNLWNNYWVIYQWLNIMRDQEEGYYGVTDTLLDPNSTPPDYQTDMTIYGMNEFDKNVISWTYHYAFPTNLSQIDWSERDTEEIECTATFQFSQVKCQMLNPDV